eukprot:TRINITY_DN13912_c0_g1_i1.p1 TRINITY_DN13912_c0_g1~~TRINITY_DN13912_c0_g1_i1.p1  ORF type:complete len:391 (+),score=80.01 TRINITY_DN13912_c0_g1_i1:183-1355(+)
MATSVPTSPKEEEASWTSPKRRPRPGPLRPEEVEIARDSGAVSSKGTFGKADRFNAKLRNGTSMHSPNGDLFYGRNALFKAKYEYGPMCTQGKGNRPGLQLKCAGPQVGPGSYDIVHSAAGKKSPLDGPRYCSMSIGKKLPSSLVPVNMCGPGPHAKYEVRKPLAKAASNDDLPQPLSFGTRAPPVEDTDGPGPGFYSQHHKTVQAITSCPNFRTRKDSVPGLEATNAGGTKQFLKSTFGVAPRFKEDKKTPAQGGMMYSFHQKSMTSEDYLRAYRSCSMGGGNKTDFSNPMKLSSAHRLQVSPVTYHPVSSSAKKTSAMDGFTNRCASPIYSACKMLATHKARSNSNSPDASPQKKCMPHSMSETLLSAGGDVAGVGGGDAAPEAAVAA